MVLDHDESILLNADSAGLREVDIRYIFYVFLREFLRKLHDRDLYSCIQRRGRCHGLRVREGLSVVLLYFDALSFLRLRSIGMFFVHQYSVGMLRRFFLGRGIR